MERVTISELKNRLSAFLQKVRAGQTILVLDRNRPVARIEGVGARDPGDRLSRLERSGLLRRGTRRLSVPALRTGAPTPTGNAVDALIDERREGR